MMPNSPAIRFLGSSFLGRVAVDRMARLPEIPLERPGAGEGPGVPLNRYFEGIKEVIERNGFRRLLAALAARLQRVIDPEEIREILIYSEKHGGDYHPAKVEVILPDQVVSFAMNVALSDRGCALLAREFSVLNELQRKYDLPFLPRTYFLEETESPSPGKGLNGMAMYMADWLEGFFEFHLIRDRIDGGFKMALWDSARQDHVLPDGDAEGVYKEIIRILTSYYDPYTFAQIHPWHLAAGDFIARVDRDRVEVRLVAAREYGPLIGPADLPPEEALLFFFLGATLHLRLDRLEGIGETTWAEEGCLLPAGQGFLQALQEKQERLEMPRDFIPSFLTFLHEQTKEDLAERLTALLESVDPNAPDFPILQRHLREHLDGLFQLCPLFKQSSRALAPFPSIS